MSETNVKIPAQMAEAVYDKFDKQFPNLGIKSYADAFRHLAREFLGMKEVEEVEQKAEETQ